MNPVFSNDLTSSLGVSGLAGRLAATGHVSAALLLAALCVFGLSIWIARRHQH